MTDNFVMKSRYEKLGDRLARGEIVILDGGIGSEMLRRGVTWEGHKVESEQDTIRAIHADMAPGVDDMRAEYRETVQWFKDAGADLMLFETFNSSKEARMALEAARDVGIPAWVGFVCDNRGRLLNGEIVPEVARALAGTEPDVLLFNCAPVPDITCA